MSKDWGSNTRVDVERFDGSGDFSLWKIRMLAYFGIHGLKEILVDPNDKMEKQIPFTKTEEKNQEGLQVIAGQYSLMKVVPDKEKRDKNDKATGVIVANVGNQVLRKIKHCKNAAEMWILLEKLYTETSLPNRIHLQLKFYTFKMSDSKSIDDNVDEFLKIVAELGSLEVIISDEVQAILLLTVGTIFL